MPKGTPPFSPQVRERGVRIVLEHQGDHDSRYGRSAQSPPRSSMPAGTHLVVFGEADHCMLSIIETDDAGEGLTARTSQIGLLAKVAADRGMLRTELYVDGQVRRGMGQVTIERFGERSDGWFRVVHRDQGLRALSARLTQGEVAGRLGRHQPFISNIENGERRIDVIELLDLASVVDFDIHQLIDELAEAPTA